MLTFPVAREHAGLRLDRFVQTRIPRISRTRAQAIVKRCAVHPDGRRRRASERVRAGEVVMIVRPPMNEPPTPQTFGVLMEDDDVLVVDKPPGLPMHPTATYHRNTLLHLLQQRYEPAPMFAHRLDKETSGLVICGKHSEAEVALKIAFEKRQVSKAYLAIVRGELQEDEGEITLPLAPVTEGLHLLMETRPDGMKSRTRFQALERKPGATLVRLFPQTGRQHQLRVHLAEIGYPILGDKLYGPEGHEPFLEMIDEGMSDALLSRLGHPRQALHAERLRIRHPRGHELALEAPFAPDLAALWAAPERAMRGEPVCGWSVITGA